MSTGFKLMDEVYFLNKKKKRGIHLLAKYSFTDDAFSGFAMRQKEIVFFIKNNQLHIGLRYKNVISTAATSLFKRARGGLGMQRLGVPHPGMIIKEEENPVRWKWEFSEPLVLEDGEFRHSYWREGKERITMQFIVDDANCIMVFHMKMLLSGKYGGEKEFQDLGDNSIIVMTRFEFNLLKTKAKKMIQEKIDGGG
jgi:hypothetical protein